MINKTKNSVRNRSRLIWIIGAVLLLAIVAFISLPKLTKSGTVQTTAQTALVERGSIKETTAAQGLVSAEPTALLTWESGGIVSAYTVKVGDRVKKGDVLLELEDSSKSVEILQAQTTLLDAQAAYDKLVAADTNFQAALKNVTYQEQILVNRYDQRHAFYGTDVPDERVNGIYNSYKLARQEVWTLEANYENVRKLDEKDPTRIAAYDALQAGILKRDGLLRAFNMILGTPYGQVSESYFIAYDQQLQVVAEARATYAREMDRSDEISAARANVQALQNTIDQARVIAPFSGTVTAIDSIAGEQVSAGDSALQLDDLSNLMIDLQISQLDIPKIILGQSADITFSAVPNKTYQGLVADISSAGTEVSSETVFNVRVSLVNPDELVKPAFTAIVNIITQQADNVLLIPNAAIQYNTDGSAYVMAANNSGGFSKVPIQTGAHSDAFTELKSGNLKEGDSVAVVQVKDTTLQFGPNRRSTNP